MPRFLLKDYGTSLVFNGSSDFVQAASVPSTQQDNWTIGGWFKVRRIGSAQGLVSNGYDGGNGAGYWLRVNASGKVTLFNSFVAGTCDGNTVLQIGRWYHIVAIRSSGTERLYLNAVDEGDTETATPNVPASFFTVGARVSQAGVESEFLNGWADDVRQYNRAISLDELTKWYSGEEISSASLRLLYKFDEGSGTSATDSGASGTTGTITGATYSNDVVNKARTIIV